MDEVIATIDCITNGFANTRGLLPWLSIRWRERRVNTLRVRSVEWVPRTNLIEHNVKLVSRVTIETWHVCTTKWMTSHTVLQNHGNGALQFLVCGRVITGPVCAVLLRAHEEAASEHKGTLLVVISLKKSTEGGALMKGTVGVMDLQVGDHRAVNLDVDGVHGHGVRVGAEHGWLIHVVPEAVHVVATVEHIVVEEIAPEVLRIGVQEVDPGRVARPAVTEERLGGIFALADEDVGNITSWLFLLLQFHPLVVNKVVLRSLDMRVNYHDNAAPRILNLFIHLSDLVVGEVLRIELEVLIALWIVVLLGPLDIAPKHIDGEPIVGKVLVALHQHLCRDWVPLAEVEAEHVQEGQWSKASDCGEILHEKLDSV